MACTDMAILEHSVVKSYGGGVYRRGRLLLSIVNAAKEMGYTALRDKPEKEAIFLGKESVCLSATVLTRRGAV